MGNLDYKGLFELAQELAKEKVDAMYSNKESWRYELTLNSYIWHEFRCRIEPNYRGEPRLY